MKADRIRVFFKNYTGIIRNTLLLFSCALPCLNGLSQIRSNDIWLHLRTGQWIWQHHAIPHTQLYSFLLGDKAWIDHEWLFQAIVYPIFKFAGINGLVILRFLVICLILYLFFIAARRTRRYFIFSASAIIISMAASSARFFVRPEIFSILFVVSFIYILKTYSGRSRIFLLLPIQVLWVNMHGYFILGPALVAIFLLSKIIESKLKLPFSWNENALDRGALIKVFYILLLLPAASLINPYFTEGALYPFKILSQSVFGSLEGRYPFRFVAELNNIPILSIIYPDENQALLSMSIIIFMFSLLINLNKIDLFDPVVFLVFFVMTLKAERHFGMLALSACMLSLFNFRPSKYNIKSISPKAIFLPTLVVILALTAVSVFSVVSDFFERFNDSYVYDLNGNKKGYFFGRDESNLNYPIGAAEFIKENKIKGNIFNFFNIGSYLAFGLYPDCKVFIDGRVELYGAKLFKYALQIFSEPKMLGMLRRKYTIDCVSLPCYVNAKNAGMFRYLYDSDSWKLVFFDGQSCVFVADKPEFRGLIRDREVLLEDFRINPERDLIKSASEEGAYPASFINTAKFFNEIGITNKMLEAINIAKMIYPGSCDMHNIRAVALAKLGKPKEALNEFREAARSGPENSLICKNIGVFFAKAGHFDEAKRYFIKALRINPKDAELKRYLKEIDRYISAEQKESRHE